MSGAEGAAHLFANPLCIWFYDSSCSHSEQGVLYVPSPFETVSFFCLDS